MKSSTCPHNKHATFELQRMMSMIYELNEKYPQPINSQSSFESFVKLKILLTHFTFRENQNARQLVQVISLSWKGLLTLVIRAFTGKDTSGVKTTIRCSKRAKTGGLSDRVGFFQNKVERKVSEQIQATPKNLRSAQLNTPAVEHTRSRSAPSKVTAGETKYDGSG